MIYYTFKANDEFYLFRDLFDSVYKEAGKQLRELACIKNFNEITPAVDSINGEDVWGITHKWPDIDCFKQYVEIFADLCSDSMIDYLNSHPVKRYIVIVDDHSNYLFPETLLPNLRGQDYINWINSVLSAQ